MELRDILSELKPTPSSYLNAERLINASQYEHLMQIHVALLSTFTCEVLKPYLVVEGAALGVHAQPYVGPWNQLDQQVLDSSSSLYQSNPDVVVVAGRLEEIAPHMSNGFVALSPSEIDTQFGNIQERYRSLLEGLRRSSKAKVLVFNFAAPSISEAGMADPFLERSQASVTQEANDRLAQLCREFSDVYVFDYANLVNRFGSQKWFSGKLWHTGRIPFGAKAQLEVGRSLARYIKALFIPPCKCLVVDCDDTIWGGVLGEEGLGGIALGEEYPGNVYKAFQRKLLNLKERGVLLAVASKNDEEDVVEVFEKHSDCLLKTDDFTAMRIHWNDKATSLVEIAKELNIGVDSLAFFDDNPVERDWVRTQVPEVKVIDVPDSPLEYIQALEESAAFDQLIISDEDWVRPKMYQEQKGRQSLRDQSISLETFFEQLDMTATIGDVGPETLPRASQLLAKTNQFNLTTRRYGESELQNMIASGAVAHWLRVSDRFGDNGLVAMAIAVQDESDSWLIDCFLMSCRVMGRKIETALLSALSKSIRERGGRFIWGEYLPTNKNNMASEFYASHDFEPPSDPGGLWKWDLTKGEIPWPQFIKLNMGADAGIGR